MGFERNSSRLIAGVILVCQAGPFPLRQHCCTTSPAGALERGEQLMNRHHAMQRFVRSAHPHSWGSALCRSRTIQQLLIGEEHERKFSTHPLTEVQCASFKYGIAHTFFDPVSFRETHSQCRALYC